MNNVPVDLFAQGSGAQSLNPSIDFTWVGFKNIGDKYQGVYIGTIKNNDGYGNPQTTYLIEQPDKTVLGVGMKDSKTRFHELMKDVRIGQYVGFVYTKDVVTGKPNKAKIIEIVTNPSAVSQDWIGKQGIATTMVVAEENGEIGKIPANVWGEPEQKGVKPAGAVLPTAPTGVSLPEKIKKVTDLAKTKLNATDAADIKAKILSATGLEFNPDNLDNIILQLEMI